jgi:phosphoglucosamine mutase
MFGTSGIRGPVGETVTVDVAVDLAHALAACGYERVVVGRDARTTGGPLADALAAALREAGVDTVRIGTAATPTTARSVAWYDADAGVEITASHNPAKDNGFKLWAPSGQAFDTERRAEITEAMTDDARHRVAWDEHGSTQRLPGGRSSNPTETEAARRHVDALVESVAGSPEPDEPLDLSVVVDLGNGVGGVTVEALQRLGCDVETLNAQPDGRFPGRPSEPTAENCSSLAAHVGATDADLGIAHDGDADRMQAVDENGRFLLGDELLALFATDACEPGERAAAPVDASLAVGDALEAQGADLVRTKVGDVFVAEACGEDRVVFGGEASGAWIWPEQTLCPDGPLAACKLVELVAESGPLSSLADEIPSYPIQRGNVETDRKEVAMERINETVTAEYDDVSTLDGVRVGTEDGWFLIRPSGTQPLIRVTAEAREEDVSASLLSEAHGIVTDAVNAVDGGGE